MQPHATDEACEDRIFRRGAGNSLAFVLRSSLNAVTSERQWLVGSKNKVRLKILLFFFFVFSVIIFLRGLLDDVSQLDFCVFCSEQ